MTLTTKIKAKPFLKWAGGKTQLLSTIETFLPENFSKEKEVTYIEPFVGGGAMLFFLLQNYPNIRKAIINDVNPRLISTYRVIRDMPKQLIESLLDIQDYYRALIDDKSKKEFYLYIRNRFNSDNLTIIEKASFMIFLNRTCFNGLYRENLKGAFNVPFGKYLNPTICDEELIQRVSELLQKVEILNDDFTATAKFANNYTLFYFDPPYRPLDATSNFTSYVKESFNDSEQRRLKVFFEELSKEGYFELLSNSDCRNKNAEDCFFDELYKDFIIERVKAKRCINANPAKRGILTELLIRNYKSCQGPINI